MSKVGRNRFRGSFNRDVEIVPLTDLSALYQAANDFTVNVCETSLNAVVIKRESFVVDAQQVQCRGV